MLPLAIGVLSFLKREPFCFSFLCYKYCEKIKEAKKLTFIRGRQSQSRQIGYCAGLDRPYILTLVIALLNKPFSLGGAERTPYLFPSPKAATGTRRHRCKTATILENAIGEWGRKAHVSISTAIEWGGGSKDGRVNHLQCALVLNICGHKASFIHLELDGIRKEGIVSLLDTAFGSPHKA